MHRRMHIVNEIIQILLQLILISAVLFLNNNMDLKNRKSPRKSLSKSNSCNSLKKRKSTPKKDIKKQVNNAVRSFITNNQQPKKKLQSQGLTKKKIQQLRAPQLIIKINYKGKRLSIPIQQIDDKDIKETVIPHLIKFQKQIFRNNQFKYTLIQSWKTLGKGDILKDYFFQTGKPLHIFKGQVLDIQPIWRNPSPQCVSLKHFQIIKCIGTGGFSRVFLVRFIITGKFYALKLMEKDGLFESGKQCVVTNERDIMVGLDNPQILKLQFAFETKHFVALALQYCPGGELFYYLRKIKRMTEQQARYCFIEILMGIQYLHSKKIIYRDIKPENIMIDMDGNLKIADFGLSKIGLKPSQLAYTYCGSPQYMAPQMLTKQGHSYSVDYYCLGALLYELVTGNPPFYSRNVEKIYYSIQNQQIEFPPYVQLSNQIKMLLEGLLIKDPKHRLGSLGGLRQILSHPWTRKLKPNDILEKTIPTPIKIDLMTFNINEQEVEEGENNFEQKFQDEDDEFQHMFQDFYFQRNKVINILDEAFPSVKSDSTKQNASSTNKIKLGRDRDQKVALRPKSKDKYRQNLHIKSQSRNICNMSKQSLRKGKLKKKAINLVQNQKQKKKQLRQKSIVKQKRLGSPKQSKKNTLKRVKSSTGLLGDKASLIKLSKY